MQVFFVKAVEILDHEIQGSDARDKINLVFSKLTFSRGLAYPGVLFWQYLI
jgi:hypothetical protein